MYLLIGLGNPGKKYAANRHNVGFMALDAIAEKHGFTGFNKKFSGELAEGKIGKEKALLFKPLTYMNDSGVPTSELATFYKIPLENIIVFHDELDLPLAKIRVKQGGGNGGHNGLKSLDAHIGADYWRVRIGITHPGNPDMVTSHVLSDFYKEEWQSVEQLLKAMAENMSILLTEDEAKFMSKITLEMKA